MSGLIADVSGAGPAVVLLHGQPGSRADWAAVAAGLEADFLVIAPDRPGYGDSGGRARGFRGNAAAVVSLLDRLGVDRATVVGYSWAGGVALALAEQVPQRVTGLVLVSSVAPGEPISRLDRMLAVPPVGTAVTMAGLIMARGALSLPPIRRALKRRHVPLIAEGNEVPPPGGARSADDRPATGDRPTTGDRPRVTTGRPAIRGRSARGLRPLISESGPDPGAVVTSWRSQRVWESFVTEQRCLIDELPGLAGALEAIGVPTIVVQGDADRTVPPTAARRLVAAIPGARLVMLAGAGHLVVHQHPGAVIAGVRDLSDR